MAYIFGTDGANTITGTGSDDYIYGWALNRDLFDTGNDIIRGGSGTDYIEGGGGNDTIEGGNGNDWLFGEGGADRLFAGEGDDELSGGAGNDWLMGDKGVDILTGGTGIDRFIFSGDWATDTVTDFQNGIDKLDFGSGSIDGVPFVKFSDLLFEMVDADSDGNSDDLLIKTNNTNVSKGEVELFNVDISMIDASDFINYPGFFM